MDKNQKTKPTKKEYLQFLLEEYRNNNQKMVALQSRQTYLQEHIEKLKDEEQLNPGNFEIQAIRYGLEGIVKENLTSDKGKNYNKDS